MSLGAAADEPPADKPDKPAAAADEPPADKPDKPAAAADEPPADKPAKGKQRPDVTVCIALKPALLIGLPCYLRVTRHVTCLLPDMFSHITCT